MMMCNSFLDMVFMVKHVVNIIQ